MHLGFTWDALGIHLGCTQDALGMDLGWTWVGLDMMLCGWMGAFVYDIYLLFSLFKLSHRVLGEDGSNVSSDTR